MSKQAEYDISALKDQHGTELYRNTLQLPRLPDGTVRPPVEVIWKPPTHGTYRIFMQALDKRGAEQANRQLMLAVVVHPDRKTLLELADSDPLSIAHFLNEGGVTAFFGAETEVSEPEAL